jgi:hypothetical protein
MQEGIFRALRADGARLCEPQHGDWLTARIAPREGSLLLRVADPRSETYHVQIRTLPPFLDS